MFLTKVVQSVLRCGNGALKNLSTSSLVRTGNISILSEPLVTKFLSSSNVAQFPVLAKTGNSLVFQSNCRHLHNSVLGFPKQTQRLILEPSLPVLTSPGARNVVKFSYKGRRKTVKAVVKRFYRLHWGIWIRPRSGKHHRLWRRSAIRRKLLRTHVFCNATQSTMLDKMVTKFWRRKTYYVDDPYESYHRRPTFWTTRHL